MKKFLVILIIVLSANGFTQFKETGNSQPSLRDGLFAKENSSSLFGFLNSDNFQMRHSLSMSYESMGSNGLALSTYTNSMFLKVADNLNVQLDATLMHSPYNTFGKAGQNAFSGIYISKAAINYRPFKDLSISFQYRGMPNSSLYNPYRGYYGGYNRGWGSDYEDSFWDR